MSHDKIILTDATMSHGTVKSTGFHEILIFSEVYFHWVNLISDGSNG